MQEMTTKQTLFSIKKVRVGSYSKELKVREAKPSKWSEEEDLILAELVNKYGEQWAPISRCINSLAFHKQNDQTSPTATHRYKSDKDCKERWNNKVNIKLELSDKWSKEEEELLYNLHKRYGNKWSQIASIIKTKGEKSVKNHFYSNFRKFVRKLLKDLKKEKFFKEYGINEGPMNCSKLIRLIKESNCDVSSINKAYIRKLLLSMKDQSVHTDNSWKCNSTTILSRNEGEISNQINIDLSRSDKGFYELVSQQSISSHEPDIDMIVDSSLNNKERVDSSESNLKIKESGKSLSLDCLSNNSQINHNQKVESPCLSSDIEKYFSFKD